MQNHLLHPKINTLKKTDSFLNRFYPAEKEGFVSLFRQAYILKVFSIVQNLGLDFKPQKIIRFSDKSYSANIIKYFQLSSLKLNKLILLINQW